MLIPLLGIPMLSSIAPISLGGNLHSDESLDVREVIARSLQAVFRLEPRTCRRSWPASTVGKKSRPTNGTSMQDDHEKTANTIETQDTVPQRQRQITAVKPAELFKLRC